MLNDVEKKCVQPMFSQISQAASSAGCNDYPLLNTPENIAFADSVIRIHAKHNNDSEEELTERLGHLHQNNKETIYVTDYAVISFLKHKLGICKCKPEER